MSQPTPNERLLDAAQHLGTRNDSVNGVRKIQGYFVEEVRAALNDGANFAACGEDGRDAMAWLAQLQSRPHAGANTVAKLLIDRGYPILDTGVLHQLQGPLLEQVSAHLARKERDGKSVRALDGNTFLHVACQSLTTMSRLSTARNFTLRSLLDMAPAWVSAANEHGQTPLHVFWDRPERPLSMGQSQWILLLSHTLKECGADLMARDGTGKTALDCIGEALDEGWVSANDPAFGDTERRFAMQIQHARLELGTPSPDRYRRGPRL